MPDWRRKRCQNCGRTREETTGISWAGNCADCATLIAAANNLQIAAGVGPFAEHRLRRSIMAANRALLAAESTGLPDDA